MNAIKSYLESMFNGLPKTDEVYKAKEELLQMMEDKYHELIDNGVSEHEATGRVISEFGSIEELKANLNIVDDETITTQHENTRYMSVSEAEQFLELYTQKGIKVSLGIILIIIGTIPVILGAFIADAGYVSDKIAMAIAIPILLLAVAYSVFLFITSGKSMEQYEELSKQKVLLDDHYRAELLHESRESASHYNMRIAMGVALIIIGVIPLIVSGLIFDSNEFAMGGSLVLLLLAVSIGVAQFVQISHFKGGIDILLNQGDYTPRGKRREEISDSISSILWAVVVLVYFAVSFKFGWHVSWIVFPIAGIGSWIISEFISLFKKK